MSYLDTIVSHFSSELIRARTYNYSHSLLESYLLSNPSLSSSIFKIPNKRNELLETLLLSTNRSSTCIVYAHGLASNKLECLSVAKYFNQYGVDVCAFDFSSSGMSQGIATTYGLKEKDDVQAVLTYLDKAHNYDQYVLWGRSMGAVSIVLSQGTIAHKKVQCIVLDSPFSCFEKVALEIASRKSFIPQFMLSFLIEPVKARLREQEHNPFEMDIKGSIGRIEPKVMLIYSNQDTVVNSEHSRVLSKMCKRNPLEVLIEEDHNLQRSRETHRTAYHFVQECLEENRKKLVRRTRAKSNRGISLTSKNDRISCKNDRMSICSGQREKSVSSSIKLKITKAAHHDTSIRSIKTLSSFSDSQEHPSQHEYSFISHKSRKAKKTISINSVCLEDNSRWCDFTLNATVNKENIKPSLNMMRKNRFK